jgi:hypothetical protein
MLYCNSLIVTHTTVVYTAGGSIAALALQANLQFPCQLKQAAPLKESLWKRSITRTTLPRRPDARTAV